MRSVPGISPLMGVGSPAIVDADAPGREHANDPGYDTPEESYGSPAVDV